MAFSLKAKIFSLFSPSWVDRDSLKDENGAGFMQRFNEMLADDTDTVVLPGIAELTDNVVNPDTALVKFLPYMEDLRGVSYVDDVEATRRKILKYAIRFNKIKGTKRALEMLLNLYLGLEVTITEHFEAYTFDSPEKFDSTLRRFDRTKCSQYCTEYSVELTGAAVNLTLVQFKAVFEIIKWNQPINAKLRACTYNGTLISSTVVYVYVDADGNLLYNNEYDPDLILSINGSGDLIVSGVNASHYSINEDGDLIYTP